MSRTGRTEAVTRGDAQTLLEKAEAFLLVAELVLEAGEDDPALFSVSASLSVLGGIAASDAVCGVRLGVRSRGSDHRQAADLLEEVEPDGKNLARSLARVLDLKDGSQYAARVFTRERSEQALKHAQRLLAAARSALGR